MMQVLDDKASAEALFKSWQQHREVTEMAEASVRRETYVKRDEKQVRKSSVAFTATAVPGVLRAVSAVPRAFSGGCTAQRKFIGSSTTKARTSAQWFVPSRATEYSQYISWLCVVTRAWSFAPQVLQEWNDMVVRAASTPSAFLEAFHVFILANALRRPILVYADFFVACNSGGIFDFCQVGG